LILETLVPISQSYGVGGFSYRIGVRARRGHFNPWSSSFRPRTLVKVNKGTGILHLRISSYYDGSLPDLLSEDELLLPLFVQEVLLHPMPPVF